MSDLCRNLSNKPNALWHTPRDRLYPSEMKRKNAMFSSLPSRRSNFVLAACWLVFASFPVVHSFSATPTRHTTSRSYFSMSSPEISLDEHKKTVSEKPCYWKPGWQKSRWQRRIHLEDLRVGQKLQGTVVQELLTGRTGPKMYFEVGVGRTDSEGNWRIVNAMLRLDRAKDSVTTKRAARLRKKESVELWVSRIQVDCGRLEVCLDDEAIKKYQAEPKIPVSSLSKGTEVIGRVIRLFPFGVMVDVGANRHGLLHIKKVRKIYGKYIDKEKGLIEAGLERGARVRLCVESVDKRRLSLDFTEDVKKDSIIELEADSAIPSTPESNQADGISNTVEDGNSGMSEEELAAWAAFAAGGDDADDTSAVGDDDEDRGADDAGRDDDEEEDAEDEYDDYDEERDIEDSLGLGYY